MKSHSLAESEAVPIGTHAYMILSVVALGALVMTQAARGGPSIAREIPFSINAVLGLLILLVGALGVFGSFRSAPILLLFLLATPYLGEMANRTFQVMNFSPNQALYSGPRFVSPFQSFSILDGFQSCAMLAFTLCFYRHQSLSRNIFPIDLRLREDPKSGEKKPWNRRKKVVPKRSMKLVTMWELGITLISIPIWALLAQYFWIWILSVRPILGLTVFATRFFLICWILLVLGMVFVSLFAIWRQQTMTKEESKIIVQDAFWQETRREQRRIYRWLAWWWIGKNKRKDQT